MRVARDLRDVIEEGAAESEARGRLTHKVARALVGSGLFGLLVPRALGGIEADPLTYIEVIEELSYADGSAGWNVLATTFGIANPAAWLSDAAVQQMFDGRTGFICAGQGAPTGTATRVDGGYRVNGRFQFASGSDFASWIFGFFQLVVDGSPVLDGKGQPTIIWAFLPRAQVEMIEDSWDVIGLQATTSVDYKITDQFVSDDFILDNHKPRFRGGAMFDVGVSIAHVSWSLGVARRALDEIKVTARQKRRQGRASLIDQSTFQRDFAYNHGSLEACRSLVRSAFGAWFEAAQSGDNGIEPKAHARNAACWATKVTSDIGRFAFLAAGTDGSRNRESNRLQRCFRDLLVGSVHKHVDDNVMIDCGTVLLGINGEDLEL